MSATASDESDEERKKREPPPPLEFVKPGETQAPLPARDQPPVAWVPRPEDFERPARPWAAAPPPRRPSGVRPKVAGLSLILAGLVGMVWTYLLLTQPLTPQDVANLPNITAEEYATSAVLFLLIAFAQSAAVLGGILTFQGRDWKFAVACGVLSLLSFGDFFLGTFLGLLGLLLVLTSRREFTS